MKYTQRMIMKWQALYFCLFLLLISVFSACRVDSSRNLVGTWSTSDGGTMTFNGDGTGTTMRSDYIEFACGARNGVPISVVDSFNWSIESQGFGTDLHLDIPDPAAFPTCSPRLEFPIQFNGDDNVRIGRFVVGIGGDFIDLTR